MLTYADEWVLAQEVRQRRQAVLAHQYAQQQRVQAAQVC